LYQQDKCDEPSFNAGLRPSRVCVCVCVCVQSQGRTDKAENNHSLCADTCVPQITQHTSSCSLRLCVCIFRYTLASLPETLHTPQPSFQCGSSGVMGACA